MPVSFGDLVEEALHRLGEHQREAVAAQPGDGLGEDRHGVLVVDHRAVPRTGAHAQPHPGDRLLRGHHGVDADVLTEGQREAADLAERLGAAREQVGAVLGEPVRAVGAAGLLVGEEREHDVARGDGALGGELARERQDHRVHVLHVHRAPAPDVAVLDRAGQRVDRPLALVEGHDVEVPVHEQRGALGIGALQPREHVVPPGSPGLDHLGLEPHLAQLRVHVGGGLGLARGGRELSGVLAVDLDELAGQRHDLVLGTTHARHPATHRDRTARRRLGCVPAGPSGGMADALA